MKFGDEVTWVNYLEFADQMVGPFEPDILPARNGVYYIHHLRAIGPHHLNGGLQLFKDGVWYYGGMTVDDTLEADLPRIERNGPYWWGLKEGFTWP